MAACYIIAIDAFTWLYYYYALPNNNAFFISFSLFHTGLAVLILVTCFLCIRRCFRKRRTKDAKKGVKGAVDLKSVQLLGNAYKEKVCKWLCIANGLCIQLTISLCSFAWNNILGNGNNKSNKDMSQFTNL